MKISSNQVSSAFHPLLSFFPILQQNRFSIHNKVNNSSFKKNSTILSQVKSTLKTFWGLIGQKGLPGFCIPRNSNEANWVNIWSELPVLLRQVRSGKNRCGAPARSHYCRRPTVAPASRAAVGPTAQENPETNSLCSLLLGLLRSPLQRALLFWVCCPIRLA